MDRQCFEQLYRRTARDLLAYLARRVELREDAADLLAEVYLVAWRRWHDVPSAPADRLWLFGVARRVLLEHRTREVRRAAGADRLRRELAVRAGGTAQEDDARPAAVRAALEALSGLDRELLTLTLWDGFTVAEAAAVVGIRAGTARVRLHRARSRLERMPGLRSAVREEAAETVRCGPVP